MNIQQIVDFAHSAGSAESYCPAAEKILKGDPQQQVRNHYSSPLRAIQYGDLGG